MLTYANMRPRVVTVVSSLLDDDLKEDFAADTRELYAEMREEHYASLEERKFLSLGKYADTRY